MPMEISPEAKAMQEEMRKAMAQNALDALEKLALSANQASREVSSYGLTRTDQLITTASSTKMNEAELMHRLELETMSCFRRVATTLSGFTKISETLKKDPTGETKAYLFEKLANISTYEYEVEACNTKEKYNLKDFGNEDTYAKLPDKIKAPNSELSKKIEATLNAVNSIAYSFHSAYENPETLTKMKEECEKIAKQTLSPQEELDKMAVSLKALAPEYSTKQALNAISQKYPSASISVSNGLARAMKGGFVFAIGGDKNKNSASKQNSSVVPNKIKEDTKSKVDETNENKQMTLTPSSVAKKDIKTKPSASMPSNSSPSASDSFPYETKETAIDRFKERLIRINETTRCLKDWADVVTNKAVQQENKFFHLILARC